MKLGLYEYQKYKTINIKKYVFIYEFKGVIHLKSVTLS